MDKLTEILNIVVASKYNYVDSRVKAKTIAQSRQAIIDLFPVEKDPNQCHCGMELDECSCESEARGFNGYRKQLLENMGVRK